MKTLMKFLAPCLFFLSACLCHGQTKTPLERCLDTAMTQLAINQCASDELKSADAELNATYQKLLAAVKGQQLALQKIQAAERAWIAYRDAYLDAMFPEPDKQANYGSIFPSSFNLARAGLTRKQTDALREMIEQFTPR
jgi:uncharacterized protein YecT (DUF1311 family)